MYPRKVKKQDAIKAWGQVKASDNIEVIINMLGVFVASPEWTKNNGQYVPHPASWLRGRRWEDEIAAVADNSFLSIAQREAFVSG